MNLTRLQFDHTTDFNEAADDIDWRIAAKMMDDNDAIGLMKYLRSVFDPMAEAVESDMGEGIYDEEQRLDERDRSRDMSGMLT